jgi:hypothetical protein
MATTSSSPSTLQRPARKSGRRRFTAGVIAISQRPCSECSGETQLVRALASVDADLAKSQLTGR